MSVAYTLTPYPVVDLLTWHAGGSLDLSPKFQRNPVWKLAAKSQFVDTLLRGLPVPPIHIRLALDNNRKSQRQVIDGQQRLRAVIDFVNGRFRMSRSIDSPWAGRSFEQLDDDHRQVLMLARVYTYQYESLTDAEVLEIFSRLNKYSVALNQQELRNGKYFGQFISAASALSHNALEFWRTSRIFSEQSIARMLDVQLVSELLVLQLAGTQDKKSSLNYFYAQLDESWGQDDRTRVSARLRHDADYITRRESEARFRRTLSHLSESVGDTLPSTAFRRTPLFYSLYGIFYHRLYGIPGLAIHTPHEIFSRAAISRLTDVMQSLTEALAQRDQESLSPAESEFAIASSRQTDNLAPRETRVNLVWNLAHLDD